MKTQQQWEDLVIKNDEALEAAFNKEVKALKPTIYTWLNENAEGIKIEVNSYTFEDDAIDLIHDEDKLQPIYFNILIKILKDIIGYEGKPTYNDKIIDLLSDWGINDSLLNTIGEWKKPIKLYDKWNWCNHPKHIEWNKIVKTSEFDKTFEKKFDEYYWTIYSHCSYQMLTGLDTGKIYNKIIKSHLKSYLNLNMNSQRSRMFIKNFMDYEVEGESTSFIAWEKYIDNVMYDYDKESDTRAYDMDRSMNPEKYEPCEECGREYEDQEDNADNDCDRCSGWSTENAPFEEGDYIGDGLYW